jgi:hypothetical protein
MADHAVHDPIAPPRSSGGNAATITASALSVRRAPNTPCSARPATSTSIDGATAQRAAAGVVHRRHPLRDQLDPLDMHWRGVSLDRLLDAVVPLSEFVTVFADGGYTTNLPVADLGGGKAWLAHTYEGEPLEPEHGGPAGWSSRTCTSGRAPGGSAACASRNATSPASGSAPATATTANPGASSAIGKHLDAVGEPDARPLRVHSSVSERVQYVSAEFQLTEGLEIELRNPGNGE